MSKQVEPHEVCATCRWPKFAHNDTHFCQNFFQPVPSLSPEPVTKRNICDCDNDWCDDSNVNPKTGSAAPKTESWPNSYAANAPERRMG